MFKSTLKLSSSLILASVFIVGCDSSSDKMDKGMEMEKEMEMEMEDMSPAMETYSYSVSIMNLTAAQPFSPVALVLHGSGYMPYSIGAPASEGLEILAESGDSKSFLAEAMASAEVLNTGAGTGLILPSKGEVIEIEGTWETADKPMVKMSLVTMLVNTNDAFTALNSLDLSGLAAGESITMMLKSYDAGTEANSETADTIPGPAAVDGAAVGFDAARDDVMDAVLAHSGILSKDDGLSTSVLTEAHRWDNPVARIMITRVK